MNIDLNTFAIAGIPLLALIFGITSWIKSMGVSGAWLKATPVLLAFFFMALYQVRVAYPIGAPWIDAVVLAIAFALAAAGIYDQAKEWATGVR